MNSEFRRYIAEEEVAEWMEGITDQNVYDILLSSLLNYREKLGLSVIERDSILERVIGAIPEVVRKSYVEGYANTAAAMGLMFTMNIFYNAGARNIVDMTCHALQEKKSSIMFSVWLLSRPDIDLQPYIKNFEERGCVNTAKYLRLLPTDGIHNEGVVLGRGIVGLDRVN